MEGECVLIIKRTALTKWGTNFKINISAFILTNFMILGINTDSFCKEHQKVDFCRGVRVFFSKNLEVKFEILFKRIFLLQSVYKFYS
jgi:hypothetical protein